MNLKAQLTFRENILSKNALTLQLLKKNSACGTPDTIHNTCIWGAKDPAQYALIGVSGPIMDHLRSCRCGRQRPNHCINQVLLHKFAATGVNG